MTWDGIYMDFHIFSWPSRSFRGTPCYTASPVYRRAITSFKIVESRPRYGSKRLKELNRTILGRPGFDKFKRRYSSAVYWPAPKFFVFELSIHINFFNNLFLLIIKNFLIGQRDFNVVIFSLVG